MSDSIQKIKRVPLRELWRKEDKDFTKWLEEHIDFLNDAIGFDISIESREEKVGRAQNKKLRRKLFCGTASEASGGGAERQFRSKKVRAKFRTSHQYQKSPSR